MDGTTPLERLSRAEPMFYRIAVATQTTVGEAYFDTLTRTIRESWHIGAAFVAALDGSNDAAALMISIDSDRDGLRRSIDLAEPPWLGLTGGSTRYHRITPEEAGEDPILGPLDAKTSMTVPLTAPQGRVIGFVGLVDSRLWHPSQVTEAEALLRLVAPRASAELERMMMMSELDMYRGLADGGRDAVVRWVMADVPRVLYTNAAFERLTGYAAAELRADATHLLAPLISTDGARAAQGAEAEVRITRKDGTQAEVIARLKTSMDARWARREYECELRPVDDDWGREPPPLAGALTRAVLDSIDLPVAIIGDDERVYMNARAEAMTGATSEELLALRIVVQRGASDLSLTVRDWLKQVRRAKRGKTMIRLRARGGGERALEVRSRAMTVDGSSVLLLTATDMGEQKRREDELTEKSALAATILESVGAGILVLDGSGTVVWVNQQWNDRARIAGAHPCLRAAATGDRFVEDCRTAAAGDASAHEVAVALGSVMSTSAPHAYAAYEAAGENGEALSFVFVVTPRVDRAGVVVRHIEVTGIAHRVRELGENDSRKRTLLESLPDQLARVTRDGEIIEVMGPTRKAPVVPPLSRGSFRTNVRDVLPDSQAESLLQAIGEATQANTLVFCNLRLMYEDSERQYEVRIVPLEDSSDVLMVLRDRSAEQWAIGMTEGGENGGRRPKVVQQNLYGLTFREVAVLELMAHGASDKEIALRLGVSVFTVNKHVSRILHKMGASSRTEASIRTLREGLFVS
ncbi:MAG TPA: PAS domain-containing protein [Dehalococcoidia bacterium]|nr:PAS domain-containing protein [Dehalococcoidia bacterium]